MIAHQLTDSGINVAISDIDSDALAETKKKLDNNSGDVITIQSDAADPEAMTDFINKTVKEFGGIDILINNVGVAGPTKPCEEVTYEEFMNTLRINLGGHFAATKTAIRHLKKSDAGRVINLASIGGKHPIEYRTPYTTSKMGVIGITRTLAVELGAHDVTVNAICPGSVEGDRIEAVIENQAQSHDITYQEAKQELTDLSPMNTFVHPKDIADMVLFLCSSRAKHITGQDLNVTAGQVMH
jgi:NAD(P)-dependent dehydrogenase (short-subunit alcohol dehydrogenase family)